MPDFPIIDSHVHFYDPTRLSYRWIEDLPASLRQTHAASEFRLATMGVSIERVAVIEFLADPGLHLNEARAAEDLAAAEPLVGAFVAHAPVEKGVSVEADLEAMAGLQHVRAIRRILDGQYDRVLEPQFIAGVETVGKHNLPFEFGVSHYGLVFALELARRCPDTQFILDHLATPAIRYGLWEPWALQISALAALPNVVAKISGVLAGVDPKNWHASQVTPYLKHAIDQFGFDRLMFGSDWPMLTLAASYGEWLALVETTVAGATESEKRKLFRDTATRLYRLEN